ncbi:DNA polymerase Y family protein [Nocardia yamanashiensis]|uniref:DNA polymerase Y family protein n=1 Tax=Nocardia yamanashiensis TaxID=209247 RepID=UPI001E3A3105|nr:DNA polymerase Y family protein [Nocardia yamanashiensis]UGT39567.1 DNA polymerase Y family protein [Nocardia yamanashiensis]
MKARSRVLVVWCPDWPAVAAGAEAGVPVTRAVAVFSANRVVACSAVARAEGITRGLRRREAQGRVPDLLVAQADPDRDARLFEPVVAAVDATVPGVEVLRPGVLALTARGAARFFGSEEAAAERLVDAVAAVGVECQIGIADELSTAVFAARHARIVPAGAGAEFLAPLPVSELAGESSLAGPERQELVDLLWRLGLRRIGDFARLTPAEVSSRFGADAIAAHRCARAEPERPPSARPPSPDLTVQDRCDPAIERVDMAAFAGRRLATRLHERLSAASVACTRLAIYAETETGEQLSRIWRCAEPLTPDSTADRIRWQLDGWLTRRALRDSRARRSTGRTPPPAAARDSTSGAAPDTTPGGSRAESIGVRPGAGSVFGRGAESRANADFDAAHEEWDERGAITLLRLEPIEVVSAGALQLGLWGGVGEDEERARRALIRVQGLLGGDAVRMGVLSGGRGPGERITMVNLGDEPVPAADPAQPWPGRLPEPAPAMILANRPEVRLEAADGSPVWVSDRGLFTADPARLHWGSSSWHLTAWAGPWPLDDRWWSPHLPHGYAARAQVQLDEADEHHRRRVLLLLGYQHTWHVEGLYE